MNSHLWLRVMDVYLVFPLVEDIGNHDKEKMIRILMIGLVRSIEERCSEVLQNCINSQERLVIMKLFC